MSLTYTQFVNSIANLLVVQTGDAGFQAALPNIIDDAEQRLYRELDLLNTVVADSSASLTTGNRGLNLPSTNGTFVVVEGINIITPFGAATPNAGTRNPCTPATMDLINALFPSSAGSSVPQYVAPFTQTTVVFGPWPDQAYQVEVRGTVRPDALSASNVTTLLSWYFPDLMIAASMVFAAGYQKNYGQGVDDPKMAVTWESHLGELLKSAQTEEQRKKFNMAGWSSKQPSPSATPPRT